MKNYLSIFFVLIVASLISFSCTQNLKFNNSAVTDGKTSVVIDAVILNGDRFPECSIEDLTDIVLSGKLSGTDSKYTIFGSWDNLVSARTVEIFDDTYDFILEGKAGGFLYKGIISYKEISGEKTEINFSLRPYSVDTSALNGTGKFEAKFVFPKNLGVVKVLAYIYVYESDDFAERQIYEVKNCNFMENDVPDGISSSDYVAFVTWTDLPAGIYSIGCEGYNLEDNLYRNFGSEVFFINGVKLTKMLRFIRY